MPDQGPILVAALGALLFTASAYGVYQAAPHIKRWWNDKVTPGLEKMKNKIANKEKKDEEPETDEEEELL